MTSDHKKQIEDLKKQIDEVCILCGQTDGRGGNLHLQCSTRLEEGV